MNRLEGHIGNIRTRDGISRVTVILAQGCEIRAVVIETPETVDYLREGGQVAVLFKETGVILALPDIGQTSEPNRLPARVEHLEEGTLFTWVGLYSPIGDLGAVIPADSVGSLGLKPGKDVVVCVKTTEIMLSGQ